MSTQEHKEKIWQLIQPIGVGMLVTEGEAQLHARPMQLIQDSYDNKIWFFTNTKGGKVTELYHDKSVCLTFSSREQGTYVSLSGRGRMTDNIALKKELWNSEVSSWFPGCDATSAEVGLLEIKVEAGEHWDIKTGTLTQSVEYLKSKVKNDRPDLGENEKFGRA